MIGDGGLEEIVLAGNLDPEGTAGLMMTGLFYQVIGELDSALLCFSKAIEQNPYDAILYSNRGEVYTGLEHYDSAMIDFEKALALNSEFGTVFSSRGDAYYQMGEYDSALIDYQRAIDIHPDYAEAYFGRGWYFTNWNY